MRIVQLILSDYNLVKESGISHITADFTEDVQLIIGANGSGKSSVLRQLSLHPSVRSLFGKKGFKCLIVEHNGIYYKLESEFEKPSSPHAIYEGDNPDNLNVGRTTETQKELITEHLGITPFVDDLIMNRFMFPKWTPSKRKEFLMAHNPDDIGFVLQLAKQKASEIRAYKNNLGHLASRKIIVEQDLLSEETIAELEAEKRKISEDLGHFQQNLMDIEVGIRTLGETRVPSSVYDFSAIKRTLRSSRYAMSKLVHVDRDDNARQHRRDELVGEIGACGRRIEQMDEDILKQSSDLADLEVQYRELAPDGDLRDIENTISRLETDRDRLHIETPPFELTREELDRRYLEWETVRENLITFETCTVPLYSSRKRSLRERALDLARYRQSSYQMKLSDLENQLQDLTKRHTVSPGDIPSPCAKDMCPLYAHFMEGYQNAEGKRQDIQRLIAVLHRKLHRLGVYIGAAVQYFEISRPYTDRIQWLITHAQSNPILHGVLRKLDILSTLSSSPNRIAQRLKAEYDHVDQWLKLKITLSDLETAYALKSRLMGSQNHDTVKLVVNMENLKKSLQGLREGIQKVSTQRKALQRHLDDIQTYEGIRHTVLTIKQQHETYVNLLADKHESDRLTFLRRGIEEIRAQTFLRMSEVERTLRAQSGLQERYQEEIVKEIARIEKEMSDLIQIERALVEIPRENTIDFVNGIFEQANLLMESVWTIPFKIEPLKYDDQLNYEFQVSGDNQSTREMSECSEGQTEILSLAINLALRIQLGHLNLPLCLDEAGRTFDEKHKHNLVMLLRRLLDDKIISQLFYVSHHASMHEGFSHSETMVIREDNVLLPEAYNLHVKLR